MLLVIAEKLIKTTCIDWAVAILGSLGLKGRTICSFFCLKRTKIGKDKEREGPLRNGVLDSEFRKAFLNFGVQDTFPSEEFWKENKQLLNFSDLGFFFSATQGSGPGNKSCILGVLHYGTDASLVQYRTILSTYCTNTVVVSILAHRYW